MNLLIRLSILTLSSIVYATSVSRAQDQSGLESLSLADLLNVKITTVSKTSQDAGKAPATVQVVTAKQIRTRGYRNLAEVLNDIPGIKVNDKSDPQFYNSVVVRGINRQDRFVILMDGVRISSPTNDALPLLENLPIYLAKQIEIVFGPGSALYGADAMSGVINIITEKETATSEIEASVSAGSQGYSNQNIMLRKIFRNGVNLIAGGQYTYDRQPDFSRVYPQTYDMTSQRTGIFNSSYGSLQPHQKLDGAYQAPVKTYNGYLSIFKGGFDFKLLHHYAQVPSSTTLRPNNGVYNSDVFYGHGVTTANMSFTDSIGKVRTATSLQHSFYEVNPRSNYRNALGRMEHGYKYSFGSMMKLEEQLSVALSKKINVIGGFTYELFKSVPKTPELAQPQQRGREVDGILHGSQYYYNPGGLHAKIFTLAYRNFGTYIQGLINPSDKIEITVGVRYDHNSRFNTTVNPRLALVYTPTRHTTIKASYGTAYWAPSPQTAFEQYGAFYSMDSGRTYRSDFYHLPNPALKPTISRSKEFSITQNIGRRISFTVTGYHTKLDGLISNKSDNGNTDIYNNSFMGFPVSYVEVPVNAGAQQNYGGIFSVNSVFDIGNTRLNGWASVSYVNGKIEELVGSDKLKEVEIPLIAPWQYRAGLEGYSGNFTYAVSLLISGKQRVTGFEDRTNPYKRQLLPGYTLVNASASYNMKDRFTFFVKLQNALNTKYRNPIFVDMNDNNSLTLHGSYQDPLRVMGGLRININ